LRLINNKIRFIFRIESEETDTIDPKCDVTAFGQWSDCSAECGPGVTARFRTILNEEVTPKYCLGRMFLQQTIPCESKPCQDERDNVVRTKFSILYYIIYE